jgi:hypothetical protein
MHRLLSEPHPPPPFPTNPTSPHPPTPTHPPSHTQDPAFLLVGQGFLRDRWSSSLKSPRRSLPPPSPPSSRPRPPLPPPALSDPRRHAGRAFELLKNRGLLSGMEAKDEAAAALAMLGRPAAYSEALLRSFGDVYWERYFKRGEPVPFHNVRVCMCGGRRLLAMHVGRPARAWLDMSMSRALSSFWHLLINPFHPALTFQNLKLNPSPHRRQWCASTGGTASAGRASAD